MKSIKSVLDSINPQQREICEKCQKLFVKFSPIYTNKIYEKNWAEEAEEGPTNPIQTDTFKQYDRITGEIGEALYYFNFEYDVWEELFNDDELSEEECGEDTFINDNQQHIICCDCIK